MDATVGIFNASSLRLQCRILPASYLPPSIRYSHNTEFVVCIFWEMVSICFLKLCVELAFLFD
jgi:hypothetical protein